MEFRGGHLRRSEGVEGIGLVGEQGHIYVFFILKE